MNRNSERVSANVRSGVVTAIEGDQAWVTVDNNPDCGACASRECGSSLLAVPSRQRRVSNTTGARVGDSVSIVVSEGALLKAALLAYILPLALGITGAGVGFALLASDVHAMLGLLVGLGLGWLMVRRLRTAAFLQPRLVRNTADFSLQTGRFLKES